MAKMRCFGYHRVVLQLAGYGTFSRKHTKKGHALLYGIYSFFTAAFFLTYVTLQIVGAYDAWRKGRDANYQFLAFTMPGIVVFTIGKYFTIRLNDRSFGAMMDTLEVDTLEYGGDPDVEPYCNRVADLIFYPYFGLVIGTITSIGIYSAYVNFERNRLTSRDPPFPVYSIWSTDTDASYVAIYLYSLGGIYWFGLGNVFGDSLIVRIMVHVAGRFKTLRKLLENAGDDALDALVANLKRQRDVINMAPFEAIDEDDFAAKKKWLMTYFTEDEFNEAFVHRLKESIRYHQLIVRITNELQKAYTYGFFCQILSSFYVIAIVMANTAQNSGDIISVRFVNNLTFLTSILWQLFIQTYSANEITIQASKVAEGAFNSPWYTITKDSGRVKALLIILIQNTQLPIYLKAAHFIPVSNNLFVAIVRRSYEIFTLITSTVSSNK